MASCGPPGTTGGRHQLPTRWAIIWARRMVLRRPSSPWRKARLRGCAALTLLCLLVESKETDQVIWVPSQETVTNALEALTTRPEPPPTIQTLWPEMNLRMVAIWNGLHQRPPTETFHEFLIEVPLKGTLGKDWWDAEQRKPEKERQRSRAVAKSLLRRECEAPPCRPQARREL